MAWLNNKTKRYNQLKTNKKKKLKNVVEYNISERATSNKYIKNLWYYLGGASGGFSLSAICFPFAWKFYCDMKEDTKTNVSLKAYKLGLLTYIGSVIGATATGDYEITKWLLISNALTSPLVGVSYIISNKDKIKDILNEYINKINEYSNKTDKLIEKYETCFNGFADNGKKKLKEQQRHNEITETKQTKGAARSMHKIIEKIIQRFLSEIKKNTPL
ncbi:MAG: hypothetical protein COS22_00680 [Candidatus Huberarchaeum crystalense]|uniref:Uncharacterized protein n=1 Tax=Huberarchaeum crystalense TaxID=2014257 RepID=A0A2H9M9I4_HUBC1|nr:MAG: hypothetical protein COS22_00680 [Candidatus Huberarchaeum crystalense]